MTPRPIAPERAPRAEPASHGAAGYFDERRRNGRRIASLQVGVGLALLGALLSLRSSPLGERLRDMPAMRFGFAGPPRYLEHMQADARPGRDEALRAVGRVVVRGGRAGGRQPRGSVRVERPRGTFVLARDAARSGSQSLVARAIASRGAVPVMQSSELVIELLVRPDYPEEARANGREGHVAVLARVDTLGSVAEAEVMKSSGDRGIDDASRRAVLRCRFQPYRPEGRAIEVYAVFRFAFLLD